MAQVIAAVLLIVVIGAIMLRLVLVRSVVMEYQVGLLYRNGRFMRRLSAGAYWLFTPLQTMTKIDVRPRLIAVPGQEVITSDGVSVKLSVAGRYAIVQPEVAVNKVGDFQQALYQVLQLNLREIVSASTGDELLSSRGELGTRLQALATPAAEEFGLQLQEVNLKDLTLPGELKKIYAQAVMAQKEGQAALERARGETAALRNLANAARMVNDNPTLMQLRLIQQLGASSGNTIILGMPPNTSPVPITPKEHKEPPPSLPSPPVD